MIFLEEGSANRVYEVNLYLFICQKAAQQRQLQRHHHCEQDQRHHPGVKSPPGLQIIVGEIAEHADHSDCDRDDHIHKSKRKSRAARPIQAVLNTEFQDRPADNEKQFCGHLPVQEPIGNDQQHNVGGNPDHSQREIGELAAHRGKFLHSGHQDYNTAHAGRKRARKKKIFRRRGKCPCRVKRDRPPDQIEEAAGDQAERTV